MGFGLFFASFTCVFYEVENRIYIFVTSSRIRVNNYVGDPFSNVSKTTPTGLARQGERKINRRLLLGFVH